jgi:hypothetical protein
LCFTVSDIFFEEPGAVKATEEDGLVEEANGQGVEQREEKRILLSFSF